MSSLSDNGTHFHTGMSASEPSILREPSGGSTFQKGGEPVIKSRSLKSVWRSAFKRAALYFLGLDLLAFFYYILGNFQGFLSDTQILLLRVVSALSAAAFLAAFGGLVRELLVRIRRKEPPDVIGLIGWLSCMAAAAVLSLLSQSVRAFAAGI